MLIPVAISALLAMVAVWFAAKQRGGTSWLFRGQGHYGGFQSVYEMGPPPQYQHAPPQFYPTQQAYPQQPWPQPVYVAPPQGFQPGPYQPPPQVQKSGPAVGEQPIFR